MHCADPQIGDPRPQGRVPRWRDPLLRALLAAVVAIAAAALYGVHLPGVSVQFELRSTLPGTGQVFWAADGVRYSPLQSLPLPVRADGAWHRYRVQLPAAPVRRLRFDPGTGDGHFALRELTVRDGARGIGFDARELRAWQGVTHHVLQAPGQAFAFDAHGRDPYVEIRLPATLGGWNPLTRATRLAGMGLTGGLAWLLLEGLARALRPRLPRMPAVLVRLTDRLGDDGVLRPDAATLLVFAGLFTAAAMYVALALNQSSIGIWETVYPNRPVTQAVDLGEARRIRSDEWKVQTPWVLNQVQAGNPWRNREIGGLASPLLASMPVDGWLAAPHLKFAGFRFFGTDRGVSWWWAYKTFGTVIALLWLLLILTRGNLAASLLGTSWIWFSSFTQWWLSSNLPEILAAFALGMVGTLYMLLATKRVWIVAGCVLVFYAAANCALNLYPPFLVPLAYLGAAILAGFVIRESALPRLRQDGMFRLAAFTATVVATGAYFLAFFTAAAQSIEAVRNTVYPGHRVVTGWEVPLDKALSGFFEALRVGESAWPLRTMSSNASEASSFLLLAPAALLLFRPRAWLRRENALLVALLVFGLVAGLWIVAGLPPSLRWLGTVTGWSLAPPKRVVLALGLASILACTVLFAQVQAGTPNLLPQWARRLAAIAAGGCVLLIGLRLRLIDPAFLSPAVLALGTGAAGLIAWGLASGGIRQFVAGVAICSLATVSVNPLQSGTSALTDKPILRAAARVGDGPADRWLVVGDNFFAQGLRAQGLAVFGGAQYLPNFRDIAVLDPRGDFRDTWNRYAYVSVRSEPHRRTPLFRKTRGDQYVILLDVCSQQTRALGISRIAYTVDVPAADRHCLRPLPAPADSGVHLFALE